MKKISTLALIAALGLAAPALAQTPADQRPDVNHEIHKEKREEHVQHREERHEEHKDNREEHKEHKKAEHKHKEHVKKEEHHEEHHEGQ